MVLNNGKGIALADWNTSEINKSNAQWPKRAAETDGLDVMRCDVEQENFRNKFCLAWDGTSSF